MKPEIREGELLPTCWRWWLAALSHGLLVLPTYSDRARMVGRRELALVLAAHLRRRFDAWTALPGDRFYWLDRDTFAIVEGGRPGHAYGYRVSGQMYLRHGLWRESFPPEAVVVREPLDLTHAHRSPVA